MVDTIEIGGIRYTPKSQPIDGLIEQTTIGNTALVLRGWLANTPEFPPPHHLALLAGDQLIPIGQAKSSKAEQGLTEADPTRLAFEVRSRAHWSPRVSKGDRQRLLVTSAAGTWSEIGIAVRQSPLAFDYTDARQFFEHLQIPDRRLEEKSVWGHHARYFFDAHPNDPVLRAGALTIIGYRLLDRTLDDPEGANWCLEQAAPVLKQLAEQDRHPYFRWLISLTLLCHYLRVAALSAPPAIDELRAAFAKRNNVADQPAQATNTLKLAFNLGTALWNQGFQEEAECVLLASKNIMRSAASTWRFENFYSTQEFIQAASLVRACLLRLETLRHAADGVWRDRSYDRPIDGSQYACLGAPMAKLVREGRA